MTKIRDSRRDFLKSGGSIVSASWLAINMPLVVSAAQTASDNNEAGMPYVNITVDESIELSALVDQIIPPDETPGATEAGVVYFIDAALGSFMSGAAPGLRQGLEDLRKRVELTYPATSRFSGLALDQQTKILKSAEDTPLFGMLYFLTMSGMFCLPGYGGNRKNAGWDLIGFDHRHAWLPPFGYYDATVHSQIPSEGDEHEYV